MNSRRPVNSDVRSLRLKPRILLRATTHIKVRALSTDSSNSVGHSDCRSSDRQWRYLLISLSNQYRLERRLLELDWTTSVDGGHGISSDNTSNRIDIISHLFGRPVETALVSVGHRNLGMGSVVVVLGVCYVCDKQ